MKPKREAGGGVVPTGFSHSTTSNKSRGRPKKEPSAAKKEPQATKSSISKATQKSRTSQCKRHAGLGNLTVKRVTNVIAQLDNARGSTLDSIRSKLNRCGLEANTSHVRNALERAIKAGLIKEIREERFTLPSGVARLGKDRPSTSNLSTSSSSRTRVLHKAPTARLVATAAQGRRPRQSLACDLKRRQRRPPQGRRPALDLADGGSYSDDSGRDDDRQAGDGDVDCDTHNAHNGGVERKESIGNSLTEPVAGCDAVMVFGTH